MRWTLVWLGEPHGATASEFVLALQRCGVAGTVAFKMLNGHRLILPDNQKRMLIREAVEAGVPEGLMQVVICS